MDKSVRKAISLIRECWKSVLLFEIIYRLFTAFAVFPAAKWIMNNALRASGIYYITTDNLRAAATNPIMFLAFIAAFLLYALTISLEFTCLITCLHSGHAGESLSIFQLIYEGARDTLRFLRPRNFPLLLASMLIVPLMQAVTPNSLFTSINFPWSIILDEIWKFPYILIPIFYVILMLIMLCLFPYVYHRYILEDISSRQSLLGSLRLSKKQPIKRLVQLVLWLCLSYGAVYLGASLLSSLFSGIVSLITSDLNLQYRIKLPFVTVLTFLKGSFAAIASYAYISVMYYQTMKECSERIPKRKLAAHPKAQRFNTLSFYVVGIVCVLSLIMYDSVLRPTLVRLDALEYMTSTPTLVIAHRGYFPDVDENTNSAFAAALDVGVDYIELDVQQTADGVVIVNHDNSLKRIFGINRDVWRMTYDEISKLRSKKTGECPPTLQEVIQLCGINGNLLIELKNNGHNPNLPQAVYDILVEMNFTDRVVVHSSSYKMIQQFKAIAPDIRCGFILSFALGQYVTLDAADFFSMDFDFATEAVVDSIHSLGKSIYVWTVNDQKQMADLIAMGVDGIITDEAPLAKTVLLEKQAAPIENWIAEPFTDIAQSEAGNPETTESEGPEITKSEA